MSDQDKIATVKAAYAGFFAGDLAAFLRNFDGESVLIEADSLPYGGTFRGPAQCGQALGGIARAWRDIDFRIVEYTAGGAFVIVYGIFTATGRSSGATISQPLVEVWEFDGSRVVSLRAIYADTAAVVAALG